MGECIKKFTQNNAPKAIKESFIAKSGADACNETITQNNTITQRNFLAIMESIMIGAGKDGRAELASYVFAQDFLESNKAPA